jgi:hypothetical protein
MKVEVIGSAKTLQLFKGTEADCILAHCYSWKGAWIVNEIFENWSHKHFFQKFWFFWKRIAIESSGASRQCLFTAKRVFLLLTMASSF